MMNNITDVVASWSKSVANTTTACGAIAIAAGWWVYDQLITHPLRSFYFKGPWWHNIPQSDICARMMGNKPEFPAALYNSSDYMREQCTAMVEREFESWNTTIIVSLYFTVLTFGVLQLLCHCCIVRPIIKAIRPRVITMTKNDELMLEK